MDKEQEYTSPENRGTCHFCGKDEGGYAKADKGGVFYAACWPCVKPTGPFPEQKRRPVGSALVIVEKGPEAPLDPAKPHVRLDLDPARVVEMYEKGQSLAAIMEAFGYDTDTAIKRVLRKAGIFNKWEN
jgi:hypothetical protein